MKLRDVAKGTWAVKPVTLRLANAQAVQPGQPPSGEAAEFKLGLRILTGAETAEVYEKAAIDARAQGVEIWNGEHELCRIHLMAHTLALAGVDVDAGSGLPRDANSPEPCFESAEEIRASQLLGLDNIVYLYEQWIQWQDECSPRFKTLPFEEMVGLVLSDLARKKGDEAESPLVSLPHATLVSCVRTMGAALFLSPTDRSRSGMPDGSSSTETNESDENEAKPPEAKAETEP